VNLVYEFDIVGGGFDGAPGLAWLDDGKHPCPDSIFVGRCPVGQHCGSSKCSTSKAHVSFWTPDEQGRPLGAVSYAKQSEFVVREDDGELAGRAVYALGGLLDPRNFGAAARSLDSRPDLSRVLREAERAREMVPAGRHELGWPA
jgi:hypothetical protein